MRLFTTGVFNEVDATALGLAMANQIRDDAVLHDAWELVEEFTPSGGPRWTVFRCLAEESGLTEDFYVVMELATGGKIRMSLCEAYDESTNTMSFMARTLSGGSITYDADGRWAAGTFVLNTDQLGLAHMQEWTPSGGSSNWWLIVGDDTLTVAFNGAANGFFHVGAYEPLSSLEIVLPLQIIGSSTQEGGITRNPAVAGETATDVAMSFSGGGGTSLTGPILGFQGSLKDDDALQGGMRAMAEQGMSIYNWFAGQLAITGWALGKQKYTRVGANGSAPSGFAWGDAYVLDGTLWVPYHPSESRIWDTGVAA